MKITKHARILSILLALMMVFSTAAVFAEGEDPQVSEGGDGVATITTDEDFDAAAEAADVLEEAPATDVAQGEGTISLNETTLSLKVGESKKLEATATDADGTAITDILWDASNDSVATVTGGTVKGVKAGTVTITATADGIEAKAECAVTVSNEDFTDVKPTITKF